MMMSLPQENVQDTTKIDVQEPCLVLQVVPPRANSSRDIAALETVMQGLALWWGEHRNVLIRDDDGNGNSKTSVTGTVRGVSRSGIEVTG